MLFVSFKVMSVNKRKYMFLNRDLHIFVLENGERELSSGCTLRLACSRIQLV